MHIEPGLQAQQLFEKLPSAGVEFLDASAGVAYYRVMMPRARGDEQVAATGILHFAKQAEFFEYGDGAVHGRLADAMRLYGINSLLHGESLLLVDDPVEEDYPLIGETYARIAERVAEFIEHFAEIVLIRFHLMIKFIM